MDDDALEWKTKRIDKSKPPLRWFANWAGSVASKGIIDISYMHDNADGWKYRINLFLWNTFWPIYQKYGTFYEVVIDEEEDFS